MLAKLVLNAIINHSYAVFIVHDDYRFPFRDQTPILRLPAVRDCFLREEFPGQLETSNLSVETGADDALKLSMIFRPHLLQQCPSVYQV
jgi:hypothetical protein